MAVQASGGVEVMKAAHVFAMVASLEALGSAKEADVEVWDWGWGRCRWLEMGGKGSRVEVLCVEDTARAHVVGGVVRAKWGVALIACGCVCGSAGDAWYCG